MQNEMMTPCEVNEDEIDLKELFITIWKYKFFILLVSLIVTLLTIIKVLEKPNIYKVYTLLAPREQPITPSLEELMSINSGSNNITPDIEFQSLLNDYPFMKKFIQKNRLDQKLSDPMLKKDYIFPPWHNKIYSLFPVPAKTEEKKNNKRDFFSAYYSPIKSSLQLTTTKNDKKISLITISCISPSRRFAKDVLTSFLKDATKELVHKNINYINSQIKRYKQELQKTNNLELRSELIKLIASLIKQKVYINTSEYYKVKIITAPFIPDPKDKVSQKRAFKVAVSFLASLIFSIILVFFYDFIKKDEK